jgi:GT2 family glycosyltransferase
MYSEGFPDEIKFKEYFLCSGQFAFGEMQAFKECLPDPRTFFYGEEQLLAIRLSTRGWRIFSSNTNVLHHKGVTEEDWQEVNFWRAITKRNDYHDAFANSDLEFYNKPLTGVTYDILSGKELGYWGAPDQDSYEQYIGKLGFDYRSLNEIQR